MLVERYADLIFCDGGGNIQEVSEEFPGLSAFVFTGDLRGHESVEESGHQLDLQVEIDFQHNHRREGIDVKKHCLNERALSVTRRQGGAWERTPSFLRNKA